MTQDIFWELSSNISHFSAIDPPSEVQEIISMYQTMIQQTYDYGIENCFTFKPILDVSYLDRSLQMA
jgi:hypothetical protein